MVVSDGWVCCGLLFLHRLTLTIEIRFFFAYNYFVNASASQRPEKSAVLLTFPTRILSSTTDIAAILQFASTKN